MNQQEKLQEMKNLLTYLLDKNPQYYSKREAAMLVPLSHYNHYLSLARAEASEMQKYEKLLEGARGDQKRRNIRYYLQNKKRSYAVYMAKAEGCLLEAIKLEAELKRKAEEEKAKREAEARAQAEAQAKADAEAKARDEARAAAASLAEANVETEEPAA